MGILFIDKETLPPVSLAGFLWQRGWMKIIWQFDLGQKSGLEGAIYLCVTTLWNIPTIYFSPSGWTIPWVVTGFSYFCYKCKQVVNTSTDCFCLQHFLPFYTCSRGRGAPFPHHTDGYLPRENAWHLKQATFIGPEGKLSLIITNHMALSPCPFLVNSAKHMPDNLLRVIFNHCLRSPFDNWML